MKPQTTKKLFAFIIMMVVSISFLEAQTCKGSKVQICKTIRLNCIYMCVPPSKVAKYESEGWGFICSCGYAKVYNKAPNKIILKKTLAKTPSNNAVVLSKGFQREN